MNLHRPFAVAIEFGSRSAESSAIDKSVWHDLAKALDWRLRRVVRLGPYPVDLCREIRRAWMDKAETILISGWQDRDWQQLVTGLGLAWDRLQSDPKNPDSLLVGMREVADESHHALVLADLQQRTICSQAPPSATLVQEAVQLQFQ